MTPQEIEVLRSEALKEKVDALSDMVNILKSERDAAMREASELAMSIWRAEFHKLSPDFELCDSPAGVISQIDNMYAAVRAERDALAARIQTAERVEKIFSEMPELTFDDCLKLFATEIRDIQAEARRAGWNACVDWLVENSSNLGWFSTYFTVSEFADKVRQGGAE